jgi:dephospho-CoA kinase
LIKIGITGGIGSGKTLVSSIIEKLGYPIFYSDIEAKIVLDSDQKVKSEMVHLFGGDIYSFNKLNKELLSKLLFSNKSLIEKVNSIVHPVVRLKFDEWSKNQNSSIVFNEAAILFETEAYKRFDSTILVIAPKDVRIKRVMLRDGLSKEQIISRINNQWLDEDKISLATYVISNNGNEPILSQIENVIEQLTVLSKES